MPNRNLGLAIKGDEWTLASELGPSASLGRHYSLHLNSQTKDSGIVQSCPYYGNSVFSAFESRFGPMDHLFIYILSHGLMSYDSLSTLLYKAIRLGKRKLVRNIVLGGEVELDMQISDGFAPIHAASICGNSSILECIIKAGADTNLQARNGATPLHLACQGAFSRTCVDLLLQNKAKLNIRGEDYRTEIHYASQFDSSGTVELLVERGADISAKDCRGWNALHYAAKFSRNLAGTFLISAGIEVDAMDTEGTCPLHLAAGISHGPVVVELVVNTVLAERGTDGINDSSDRLGTPLYAAVHDSNFQKVQILLDAGADIAKIVTDKISSILVDGPPLFVACARGFIPVVMLLLSRGASLEAVGCKYRTAYEFAEPFEKEDVRRISSDWELARAVGFIDSDEVEEDD